MERKRSLIVAGVVSGTLLAASTSYALTAGVPDRAPDDGAGTLAPVTATVDGSGTTARRAVSSAPRAADEDDRLDGQPLREHIAGSPRYEYEGAGDDD